MNIDYAAIAERLDPQHEQEGWWARYCHACHNTHGEPFCMNGWAHSSKAYYTGPTDPALAWAAFEPLVTYTWAPTYSYELSKLAPVKSTEAPECWLEFNDWLSYRCTSTDRLLALQAALGIGGEHA